MKILMPVDGSRYSNAALDFVCARGTLTAAIDEVELLNVQPSLPLRALRAAGAELVRAQRRAEADAVLQPAMAKLRRAGLAVRARRVVGNPGPAVGACAAASDADLVVMGSRGRTALKGLLFGSVASAVLASCRKPLLLLRGAPVARRDSLAVGIALDGSAYGLAAARFVLRHRQLFGTAPSLHLIHVVPDLATIVIPGFGDAPAPLYSPQKILAAQAEAFDAVMAPAQRLFAKEGLAVETVCRASNSPGDEIAAHAGSHDLDLLVMGSHGRGALKSALLGSVAMRVAARCATPLLLVRPR